VGGNTPYNEFLETHSRSFLNAQQCLPSLTFIVAPQLAPYPTSPSPSFSVTASIDNYSASDALKFVISMGVINWLYQSVLLGNYAGATFAHHEIMPVDMVENKYAKLGDIFMMFMFYTSTICASVDSSECIFSGVSDYHGSCSKLHAAACFSWFGFFGIIGGVFLRDPETFKKLVVGVKSDHYDDIDGASAGAPAVQQKAAVDL